MFEYISFIKKEKKKWENKREYEERQIWSSWSEIWKWNRGRTGMKGKRKATKGSGGKVWEVEEIWMYEEEVGRKYARRRGRPWTSKTKAQERPKKKIKRETKRRTGWKKGGLEKITTLNRKLNKKRGWKNIARAKRWARAMENEAREELEGKNNTLDTENNHGERWFGKFISAARCCPFSYVRPFRKR